jgi:hypothetical protein
MVCEVQEKVVPVSIQQWPRSLTASEPKDRKIICYKYPHSKNAFTQRNNFNLNLIHKSEYHIDLAKWERQISETFQSRKSQKVYFVLRLLSPLYCLFYKSEMASIKFVPSLPVKNLPIVIYQ